MIRFSTFTCMRPGEVFVIEWPNITDKRVRVEWPQSPNGPEITRPKTGEPRTIVLPPPAREALSTHPRRPGTERVFSTTTGEQFKSSSGLYYCYWSRVRDAARLEGIKVGSYYELRHSGATYLYENMGLDMRQVRKQLGHVKDSKATNVYPRESGEHDLAVMDEAWAKEIAEDRAADRHAGDEVPSAGRRSWPLTGGSKRVASPLKWAC
jgi:integrase